MGAVGCGCTCCPSGEAVERARVVDEARRWLGTPFHHAARVRGAGVDCAQLVAAVYEAAGVAPHIVAPVYPPDWGLHRDEEILLGFVERHAARVEPAQVGPGDIAVFRYGRCVSHIAIVVAPPSEILHAYLPQRAVVLDSLARNSDLAARLAGFYSPWGFKR